MLPRLLLWLSHWVAGSVGFGFLVRWLMGRIASVGGGWLWLVVGLVFVFGWCWCRLLGWGMRLWHLGLLFLE